MPQFRDINVFIEKSSLDGSEEVQVSGTQKAKLVKLLEQLGENLQMSVPDEDRGSALLRMRAVSEKFPVRNRIRSVFCMVTTGMPRCSVSYSGTE